MRHKARIIGYSNSKQQYTVQYEGEKTQWRGVLQRLRMYKKSAKALLIAGELWRELKTNDQLGYFHAMLRDIVNHPLVNGHFWAYREGFKALFGAWEPNPAGEGTIPKSIGDYTKEEATQLISRTRDWALDKGIDVDKWYNMYLMSNTTVVKEKQDG